MKLKPFNPDLMVDAGTHTNGERAERADTSLRAYKHAIGECGESDEVNATDLMCDLMHWLHRGGYGGEIESIITTATNNFTAETNGENQAK